MTTVEQVCNEALDLVGYRRHIGNIYDGTLAARVALNAWGETRDEVLILQPWDFARNFKLLIGSGRIPQTPWLYEWLYPSDCVKLLMVKPEPVPLDPQPVRWLDSYDIAGPSRVVLTTFPGAVAVYTARVLDPSSWPSDFTGTVIQMLAKKFASGLAHGEANDTRGRRQSSPRDSGQQE